MIGSAWSLGWPDLRHHHESSHRFTPPLIWYTLYRSACDPPNHFATIQTCRQPSAQTTLLRLYFPLVNTDLYLCCQALCHCSSMTSCCDEYRTFPNLTQSPPTILTTSDTSDVSATLPLQQIPYPHNPETAPHTHHVPQLRTALQGHSQSLRPPTTSEPLVLLPTPLQTMLDLH
jgi:hypothetical protein